MTFVLPPVWNADRVEEPRVFHAGGDIQSLSLINVNRSFEVSYSLGFTLSFRKLSLHLARHTTIACFTDGKPDGIL